MKCPVCGTECKVVGHTTKHYEPVDVRKMKMHEKFVEVIRSENPFYCGTCRTSSDCEKNGVETLATALLKELKESLPKERESPKGKDCECYAYHYGECACGADWSNNDTRNAVIKEIEEMIG